jgi:hypothetical protein
LVIAIALWKQRPKSAPPKSNIMSKGKTTANSTAAAPRRAVAARFPQQTVIFDRFAVCIAVFPRRLI